SANRDEEVFAAADRFDVGRTPNDHLAFGFGPHYCLGASLAQLEARVLFEELFSRYPRIAPAGPIVRMRANHIAGVKHMPVSLGAGGTGGRSHIVWRWRDRVGTRSARP